MKAFAFAVAILACGKAPKPDAQPKATTLVIRITDAGQPVGGRVLLFDSTGQLLHFGALDLAGGRQGAAACAIAPGVVGSWDGLIIADGTAEILLGPRLGGMCALPFGDYRVWAWRGIEYERFEGRISLHSQGGRVVLDIPLERAWNPIGTLAADLHVHARASNDSTLPNPQRVVAQVAAGIQVIGLSDHNVSGDLNPEIAALHLEHRVVSIASNELTAEALHLGIYPAVGAAPDASAVERATADELFRIARSLPGHPIVQLNHPRLRATALYDDAGWDGASWPPPFSLAFDAVEVLAGYSAFNIAGDRRFDASVRDLYTLFDHGHLVAPLGNSDTHDLNWVLDGTTRNYIFVDDARTQPFDEPGFIAAIRARRVIATSGPWLDVEVASTHGAPTVGPGQSTTAVAGAVWVDVSVSQTRWMRVDKIRINVGTKLARTIEVPPGTRTHHWAGRVSVGARDTFIGVTAEGDTPLPLELTGSYQKDRWNRPGVTPFAIASPILIDSDGNRRWRRGDAHIPLSSR